MRLTDLIDSAPELEDVPLMRTIRDADAEDAPLAEWPREIDLHDLAEREPEPPRHIVEPWLPEGEVTLLAGHGGAGKSAIALHLAACIALGVPWHGLNTARRRVLYLSHEDHASVVHWRLARVSRYLRVSISDIAGHLRILDASGITAEIATDSRDGAIITGTHAWLAEQMREAQVLVIDGASDSYGASEIVRRDVRRYIRALRRLIPANGACLLLAHVDKASARGKESGDHYSGSTAWNNSVRARWSLRADGDGLALAVEKVNHAKAGAEIRLRWDAQAHMHLADAAPADGGVVASIRERAEREGILAAMRECATAGLAVPSATSGRRTTYHVLAGQPSFPEALRGDSRAVHGRFWRQVEALRQCGTLRECSIRTPGRKWVGVLTIATEEARQCANAAPA